MKKYYKYMNEITDEKLYEGLLGYGLFCEKLPDFLTSKSFFDYCKNNSPSFDGSCKQYINFESIRNINVPRLLGIPNPMAYQKLCRCIVDNWDEIKKHFFQQTKGQDHKISRIHIRNLNDNNALFAMNYENWRLDGLPEMDLLIGNKYLVKADISTCFPSIYTHSIPWALVGKEEAKKFSKRSFQDKWYNQIDTLVQHTKNGETHGLLIGPHVSNLLAELILTRIDKFLYDKGWRYTRNIDDYSCYVDSYEDGQQFLIDLRSQLREFDLMLNFKKTEILELPIASSEQWVRKINLMGLMMNKKKVDFVLARAYLDAAIELMRNNEMNSAILNYVIKVLSNNELTSNAKKYSAKTIFHWALIYPYLIPLLGNVVFDKFNVTKESVEDISRKIYTLGRDTKNYEATSYAIYYALKYDVELKNIDVEDIIGTDSCVFKLLAYLYFAKQKNKDAIKALKKNARLLNENDGDFNKNWLFVYEVLSNELKGDWKNLKREKISFIKDDFRVKK